MKKSIRPVLVLTLIAIVAGLVAGCADVHSPSLKRGDSGMTHTVVLPS